MSSFENATKKRCVQKLDFENCIVTSIKTRSRVRKKLRARIIREIEQVHERQSPEASLSVSLSPEEKASEVISPLRVKKEARGDESPVFFKKKKLSTKEDDREHSSETRSLIYSPVSPVFKLKTGKFASLDRSQELSKTLERMTSLELLSQGNSSSCGQSSYQIEDFTQESKKSVKISSVESTEVKSKSSGDYSVDCKSDSSVSLNISWEKDGPDPLTKWLEAKELNNSLKNIRKNCKTGTLTGRLQKLLQKQASEKLLWQHRNRRNSTFTLKFVALGFWSDEFKFILKCRPVEPESEITFLVVDRKWVPSVKKIQEGSVLELHPPWQKLSLENPMLTVLLNVICLDILEEVKETPVKNAKLELLPTNEFEKDPSLFINSLFSFHFAELLL